MTGFQSFLKGSTIGQYYQGLKAVPRETIINKWLICTSLLYATAALPLTWDQTSAAVAPSLPGFQEQFGLGAGSSALKIRNFISIVYLGAGVGAALAFFVNDRIGRLWSFRLYGVLWIIGQMIAVSAPNLAALYASRIVAGLGMGALTVVGPMSIVEIAPAEIRGLLTSWFNIVMSLSGMCGSFCVLGVYKHMAKSRLQYQVVWFSPCIFMSACVGASFFLCDTPRWLLLVGRVDEASQTLVKLRGLPSDHPRVQQEFATIQNAIEKERSEHADGFMGIIKETFLVPSNLRRVQQSLITYGLAQLSGANSITSYFIPILTLLGIGGGTAKNMFLSAMYTMAKFFFAILASFFFVDALGRRKSLFVGTMLQMISDLYIGIYVKFRQQGDVSQSASTGAIAFIFIHGFGYIVGLYILPYVFGGELWPNRIRSFGSAFSQCFHWLFIFAMAYGVPSLLENTNNWGAFIFFAGWCLTAAIYVYFMVPEIAGLGVEEIDYLFTGSWFNAYKKSKRLVGQHVYLERHQVEHDEEKLAEIEKIENLKVDVESDTRELRYIRSPAN